MAETITLDTDTLRLVERLEELATAKAAIDEQSEALKAELRNRLTVGQTGVDAQGHKRVSVYRTASWNEDKAREVLPAALIPLCEVTKLDREKVKAMVSPTLYAECQVLGAPKVVLAS